MKKIIKPLVIASSFLVLGGVNSVASAYDDSQEFSVGISKVNIDVLGSSFNSSMLNFKYAFNFNQNWAVEASAGLGMSPDSTKTVNVNEGAYHPTADLYLKPTFYAGGFGIGKLPIGENLQLYGKLGLHVISVDLESEYGEGFWLYKAEGSDAAVEFAYGLGANFFFNKKQGINIEYLASNFSIFDDEDNIFDIDGDIKFISLNYVHKF